MHTLIRTPFKYQIMVAFDTHHIAVVLLYAESDHDLIGSGNTFEDDRCGGTSADHILFNIIIREDRDIG